MNNNKPTTTNTSKRKNDNSSDTTTKRQRPKLDMSQGPRIPIRSTLASRSNANSPTNRFSNASTSSNTSTSSAAATKRLSNTISTNSKILSNGSTTAAAGTKRLSNASTSSNTAAAAAKRLSSSSASSSSSTTAGAAAKILSNSPTSFSSTSRTTSATPQKGIANGKQSAFKKPALDNGNGSKRPVSKVANSFTARSDPKATINNLQAQLEVTGEEVSQIEKLQDDLQSTVQGAESLLLEAQQKVTDLENTMQSTKDRYDEELDKIREKYNAKSRQLLFTNDKLKSQFDGRDMELQDSQAQYRNTNVELEDEKRENVTLKVTAEKTTASYAEIDATLRDLKMKLKSAGSALTDHENYIKQLNDTLVDEKRRKLELEESLIEQETLRRKDHNRIQELKGNIRVFCRVRPCISDSAEANLANIRYFGEDNEKMELSEQISSTLGKTSTRSHSFSFDRVFSPESTQHDCFEEISQLVQSALDGYNVCIFAYGQTGSGKTFTMQGPNQPDEESMGMIPRAVQQIYNVAQQLKQFGWNYKMEGQFLEIYNESINDLLGDVSSFGKLKHEIHHFDNKQSGTSTTSVTDMTTVNLDSPSKVKLMLKRASQNRATGSTNLNERSSRSHSVFRLKLTGKNLENGETTNGILNLIDLAGSERLSMSGSVGDRLRETQAINKSLSCLGDVIQALVNDDTHVPYRNSKLTYLLKNSLGGNCKTLMFVNVSPMMEHFGETLCSLRFATKVNSCQIGTVKKSIK